MQKVRTLRSFAAASTSWSICQLLDHNMMATLCKPSSNHGRAPWMVPWRSVCPSYFLYVVQKTPGNGCASSHFDSSSLVYRYLHVLHLMAEGTYTTQNLGISHSGLPMNIDEKRHGVWAKVAISAPNRLSELDPAAQWSFVETVHQIEVGFKLNILCLRFTMTWKNDATPSPRRLHCSNFGDCESLQKDTAPSREVLRVTMSHTLRATSPKQI